MSAVTDMTQRYDPFGSNSYSTASNPWAGFFGTPPYPYKTSAYDKYDRHNYNLPEAYVGQNKMLKATVDELIYTDEDWYTSVALPYQFTDQLSVAWDKWEFNEHFTNIVPEQGVSRLVSSHREQRSESFVRRGMAAIFEHGFMSTPEGRANYVLTLRQIARAVKETTNFGVIYAYLTAHNYNRTWEEKHGYFRKGTLSELLKRNKAMWAVAQKEKNGMEKLDAQIVEWMNRYRAEADTWILPPKLTIYLRLVPTEKTDYYIAGEEGPRRVNDIVGAGRPRESNAPEKRVHDMVEPYALFKKSKVYITRTYHVDRTGPIDLMARVSQIGEYNTMIDEMDTCGYDGYDSCYRTIRIYDEDNDRGHNVTLQQALNACNLFETDGSLKNIDYSREMADDQDLLQDFLLRQVTDPRTGRQMPTPVKYFGDISEEFMSVASIGNLAQTLINNVYRTDGDRRDAESEINNGIAMIRLLNSTAFADVGTYPVNGGLADVDTTPDAAANGDMRNFPNNGTSIQDIAGATSWTALNILATGANHVNAAANAAEIAARAAAPTVRYVGADGVAAKYVRRINEMANRLSGLLGAGSNVFLDPGNALPNERVGFRTASATLHNNLINHDASIVYRLGAAGVAANDAEKAPIRTAMETMLGGFLNDNDAQQLALLEQRGVSVAPGSQYRTVYAALNALTTGANLTGGFADARVTQVNLDQMRRSIGANWKWTRAESESQLQRWFDELMATAASAAERIRTANAELGGAAGQNPQRVAYANAAQTILMAYTTNTSFSSDKRIPTLGFDLASRFDLNRVRDRERAVVGRGGANVRHLSTIGNDIGSSWQADQMPVFSGIAAAEARVQEDAGPRQQIRDDSFRIGSGLAGYQSQQIGAMYGLGFDRDGKARERQADIQDQRNWIPAAAGHLRGAGGIDQQVNLRIGNMAYLLDKISKSSMSGLRKLAAAVYLSAEVHKRTFEAFISGNVLFPMGFLLLRPHARYEMALGIKCKAGLDTGATYFGHSNFMLSDDATVKMHYGHYTHYGKSVIHNDKNVFIAYDIFANRALGGLGVRPYIKGARGTSYNAERDEYGADMFVVAIPYEEKMIPNPLDIAGRFYSYMDKGFIDYEDPSQRTMHYSTAPRYNRMWGWYNPVNVMDEVDEPLYRTQFANKNRVCWQGAQGGYNPDSKDFSKIIRNTSPWGPNVHTGVRACRDGEMREIEKVPFGTLGF